MTELETEVFETSRWRTVPPSGDHIKPDKTDGGRNSSDAGASGNVVRTERSPRKQTMHEPTDKKSQYRKELRAAGAPT